ncbi:NAD-dependent epimerase/dehydratase family protein [Flavobacterium sp. N2038]|uniref:NAD-dependent epimerase/dehydratase family protein n=1 Tax=Flavobacterium sp. N2038 TaxID=2986829 RepID=UPI002224D5B5|nr:NAD-dependent epimerase/dehydratase family protein [Flavobacterium sp. N2038]
MKITITGATGFVGTHLIEYLKDYMEINAMSVRYSPNQTFELNTDVVVHLAGKAHDLKKVSVPNEYYEANFELTKQLFDAFLCSTASVFIFISTVKAVADKVEGILKEDTIPNPQTHYGIAKHKAEEYILSKNVSKDKKVFILRPCMIHGPENKGNLNLLYKLVSKNIPWPLAVYKNERSFLSVDNLCFLIRSIIEKDNVASGVYNISDDEFLSTNDLIKIISSICKKRNVFLTIPVFIINKIARVGDLMKLPLNSETLQKLTENYRVSNQKIKIALEIDTLPMTAQQGLKKTIKSFIDK